MQLSKCNKGFRFLLCVIDIYNKYAWVVPLKDKKVLQLLMIFKKYYMSLIANQTKYDEEMYSRCNEGKSFVTERFIRFKKIIITWLQ